MVSQRLQVMPRPYLIEFIAGGRLPADDEWTALVRTSDGLTVVREAPPAAPATGLWAGLYGGDSAHGLDVPGMLAALVGPLARAGIPVFVASTIHADLVLVPHDRLSETADVLSAADHEVRS